MKVLVINAGSSSLKFQLIDMTDESVLAKGNCERIGTDGSFIGYKTADGSKKEFKAEMKNHTQAFEAVKDSLLDPEVKAISDLSEVTAIGHRVVQGGAYFDHSVLINKEVLDKIVELSPLAPLHNPAHIQGINACTEVFGKDIPQVAVFDTGFHQTMPDYAYLYALPYEFYEVDGIRRYGFHGTSHRYVSQRCIDLLGGKAEGTKIVTCHLGNGSSISAVKDGKCLDTTMGLTPLEGLIMGTRSGDVDPAVVQTIANGEGLTVDEVLNILNKKSGVLAMSGVSSDFRDLGAAAAEGNERAQLALKAFKHRVIKYIGAYAAVMNGVDAISFTGGIGENDVKIRGEIIENLAYLGVIADPEKANIRGKKAELTTPESKVRVFCLPTNEELAIARETVRVAGLA